MLAPEPYPHSIKLETEKTNDGKVMVKIPELVSMGSVILKTTKGK